MANTASHGEFFFEAMEQIHDSVTACHGHILDITYRLEADRQNAIATDANAYEIKKGDDRDMNMDPPYEHMHTHTKQEQCHDDGEDMCWVASTYELESAVPDRHIKLEFDDEDAPSYIDVYSYDDGMDVYMGQESGGDEELDQQGGVHPHASTCPLTFANFHQHDVAMNDDDDDDYEMSGVSSDTSVDKGSVYVDSDGDDSAYGDTPDSWIGEKRTV